VVECSAKDTYNVTGVFKVQYCLCTVCTFLHVSLYTGVHRLFTSFQLLLILNRNDDKRSKILDISSNENS
jgi:hypothetical protein